MKPNHTGRLYDRYIFLAFAQTGNVAQNPDDSDYVEARIRIARELAKAAWVLRCELQQERDPKFKP